ncbi:MAG: glutathione S-transferase [Comamonadaceae bacterium]|nr:MAG: glutathione S-transferase [Comamonadaceae bacterium]
MELIGMLDSPYVRRVAVSLNLLGQPFVHRPVSVFGAYAEFERINPVVKAPTLVCDDGGILMDSNLILQFIEARAGRSLVPAGSAAMQRTLYLTGLAMAACEKTVQIVYERRLRPAEKQHEPWVERVSAQLQQAYAALERELAAAPLESDAARITQAGVSSAVAWSFTQAILPDAVSAAAHPTLAAFTAQAEELPAFRQSPQ